MDKIIPFTDKCGCANTPAFRRCPLHAAAPALLGALEAVLRLLPDDLQDRVAAHRARAAIRAAKGETA